MGKTNPKVSVGVVTYNRKEAVLKAIQSVYDQDSEDFEVVVVDSASTDGTSDVILEHFPDVKLLCLPRNLGCPGGRNYVFANCRGDYIINLDDDGYLGDGVIRKVIEVFDASPDIGIIAMKRCFPDEPENGYVIGSANKDVGGFHGGVSAFRREILKKTGYYPEDFFLYHEEAFLSLRTMDAGYRIVSRPDIVMWHPKIGSVIRGDEVRREYYRFRNTLLVVTRLFPGWLMIKYLILRLGSIAIISMKRKSFQKYLLAVAYVLLTLPATLVTRKPCRPETVKQYFQIR